MRRYSGYQQKGFASVRFGIINTLVIGLGAVQALAAGHPGPTLRPAGSVPIADGVEIVVFDHAHQRLHAIGPRGRMELGFDDSGQPALLRTHSFSDTQDWEPTSIAIDPAGRGFGVVTWIPDPPDTLPGMAQVFDLATGEPVWQFTIGFHPDCVVFTPDGRHLLAANEGEPHTTDHLGAITVADLSEIERPADFAGFNRTRTYPIDDLNLAEGVDLSVLRITPDHAAYPAVNIEPEYIAPTNAGAWVSLQENDGLAYFDLAARKWTSVHRFDPLSFPFDASETDGFSLHSGEGFGMLPMPDTIVIYEADGRQYLVTANEGDKSEGYSMRLGEAIEAGLIDPAAVRRLKDRFGDLDAHGVARLVISTIDGDLDADGDLDILCPLGARSVSIIDIQTGTVVWNSGPQMELITGMLDPQRYNAGDSRSDRAGPEPEGLAIGQLGERTLLAVGLERADTVLLYDISNPLSPIHLDAAFLGAGCSSPEGMTFFERDGRHYLAVAGEIGGCLTVFQVSP